MAQFHFLSFWKRVFIQRKYKDVLFQRVFRDKKDLLDLYNALNQTNYTDTELLEITTLEDVIYLSMKNDLSFVIGSTMNLYEHQSTYNPNMPVRGLFYFARLYEAYIKKNQFDIYHEHLTLLPVPQYIVFYNGRKDEPDEMYLKLSDSFQPHLGDAKPALECRARMLNINYGHNEALLRTCKRLHDYSFFINEVEQHLHSGYTLKKAIETAINICIEKDILRDILEKQKGEVVSMLLTEYDKKLHERTLREAGRQEGRQEIADAFSRLQQGESEASILASGLSSESVTLAKQLLQSTKVDN